MIIVAFLMVLQFANVLANVAVGFPVIGCGRFLAPPPSPSPDAASMRSGRRLRNPERPRPALLEDRPSVSVLVPARNEAASIERCVRSLLAQQLDSFEVVVIDDGSTDGTGEIVAAIAAEDDRLRLLQSSGPPAGWSGKNYACHQLSTHAAGEWLVFVDADVTLVPDTVAELVAVAGCRGYDLVSGLPRAEGGTLGATWVTSAMSSFMLLAAPMWLLNGRAKCAGGLAMGQVMCFRREAYEAIGGHSAVRGSLLEDISFSIEMQRAHRPTAFLNLTRAVRADLFPTFTAAWGGLTRWFQGLAGISTLGLGIVAAVAFPLYLLPWFAFGIGLFDVVGGGAPTLLGLGLLGIGTVAVVDRATGRPAWMVLLQPLVLWIWFAAFLVGLTRRILRVPARWRGREYASSGTAP